MLGGVPVTRIHAVLGKNSVMSSFRIFHIHFSYICGQTKQKQTARRSGFVAMITLTDWPEINRQTSRTDGLVPVTIRVRRGWQRSWWLAEASI